MAASAVLAVTHRIRAAKMSASLLRGKPRIYPVPTWPKDLGAGLAATEAGWRGHPSMQQQTQQRARAKPGLQSAEPAPSQMRLPTLLCASPQDRRIHSIRHEV